MNPTLKFGVLIVTILGALLWVATGAVGEAKAYYKTIPELQAMGDSAFEKRLRVAGDVEKGSISRRGSEVHFTIFQDAKKLNVVYRGTDPLPDTFRDGAQALADGRLQPDGTFHANKIQAKCASKYEAKPGGGKPADLSYQPKRSS
ncbi:MAG: cytochrome c maturation protein CcmE [Bryobacteraceae bacterium]|nr:cytochrome c maturation protein CcmE [Bryobacteraceae bacterium]